MKAWGKRMIWFFGTSILMLLDDLIAFIVGHNTEDPLIYALFWLLLIIAPLVLMENDK